MMAKRRGPEPPTLPQRIDRLNDLASDLWWTWNEGARDVFRRLDYPLWRATAHNPVRMLRTLPPERLRVAASDRSFVDLYDAAIAQLDQARTAEGTWWSRQRAPMSGRCIAYFSAEFALHQSLPIYAGGLGVLAGDHLKEASDLGLPIVAVGFMYPQGYFHQSVSSEGWQEEIYEQLNWADAPVEPAVTPDGKPILIAVPLGQRTVLVAIWRVRLGRSKLYLLDTDLEENAPWDRELSARLYGGDRETRIQQEIILGVGGVRALRALGSDPAVWHLNEGHAAFVVLQRVREALERGERFDEALEEIRRTTVFTTHTPVAAGHDAFSFNLVEKHLAGCWGSLGGHREDFLALGQYDSGDGSKFNMTALAMRTSGSVNAVSELHGRVTRDMWGPLWPDLPSTATWAKPGATSLTTRPSGRARATGPHFTDLTTGQRRSRGGGRHLARPGRLDDRLRPAVHKRPELIFHDAERLARILSEPKAPVQVVFAGKAHPADDVGKHHLQRVFKRALDPVFGGRIAFVDDYDLHVAHFLVQGCDVWLNTPRKPLEASGTSGMKASLNGVPHLSIGDGWWAEGFTGTNGWLIDGGEETQDPDAADEAEADALYRLLENEVVPTFYDRDASDVPHRWLRFVKEAIRSVAPHFSSRRMLKQYSQRMYLSAIQPPQRARSSG